VERLVLWDIDRTLVTMAGVGYALLADALRVSTGVELVHRPDLGGRTDRELITSTLTLHGIPVAETLIERMHAEMASSARERTDHMRSVGVALPGALAALAALAATPGVVQTVVTGNIAPVARLKLAAVDLDGYIDFDIGGYGSESAVRGELVNLARSRAALKHDVTLADNAVIVIGDTVHDVVGAKFSGAIAIGVATGLNTTADHLHAAGADVVLSSLADTSALLAAVMSRTVSPA
jgi:phosphoglycolate phosphatase